MWEMIVQYSRVVVAKNSSEMDKSDTYFLGRADGVGIGLDL